MLVSNYTPKYYNNSATTSPVKSKNTHIAFCSIGSAAAAKSESKFFSFITKPVKEIYGHFTTNIAKGIGKLIDRESVVKFFEDTKDYNMSTHLMVLASTILSGFYVKRTLENDKLDQQKRKTLAVNQAAVWATSTVMTYTVDNLITKKYKVFENKFSEVFKSKYSKNVEAMEAYAKFEPGFKQVKSAVIAGIIYRYIAPVLVTPIANAIGNKINEKKEAKLRMAMK